MDLNLKKKNKKIILTESDFINSINFTNGLYKPLNGFCKLHEYENIIKRKRINSRQKWTIPILLNLKKKFFFSSNSKYYLYYKNKKVGFINAESIFKINKREYCQKIFNTNSLSHPTVKRIYEEPNTYVGGKVKIYEKYLIKDKHYAFNLLKKNKNYFSNSVVFSTRNICHLGHQLIHSKIIKSKRNLSICIIQSEKNKFDPNLIVNSYIYLKKNNKLYKKIKIIKIFLPSLMAGPNEAYLQAAYFDNLNFNSFVVGRDHAGFKNFFKKYDSQKIFSKFNNLKIKIVKTREPLICSKCSSVFFENKMRCTCNKKNNFKTINGKLIKKYLLKNKFKTVKKFLDPEIFKFCMKNISNIKKFKG